MARQKQTRIAVTPRAKVWLEVDGKYVFGLGICRILEAVEETGSIKNAAASIGKSYRHVWARIKDVEQAIGLSLVATQVGGSGTRRSALTDAARQLVSGYHALREQVFTLVDEQFAARFRKIVTEAANAATAR